MTLTPLKFQLNPWVARDRIPPAVWRFLQWYDDTLILFLGCRCNLRCQYCFAPKDLAPAYSLAELEGVLEQASRAGLSRVILTGGEPLLHPDLDPLLALLPAAGFTSFGVQTNGLRLRDPARVARLVEAGLRFCHLSYDSPDPATQDRLAGRPAQVREGVLTALENLSHHPEVALSIKAVITTMNLGQIPAHMEGLARLAERLAVAPMMTLTPMLPPAPRYDPLQVRYQRVAPIVREAIATGTAAGILTWYHHLPFCCVDGPLEASADYYTEDRFLEPDGSTTAGNLYRKGERCASCDVTAFCQGFSRNYALLFGESEFTPVGTAPGPGAAPRSQPRARRRATAAAGAPRNARIVLGSLQGAQVEYLPWDLAVSSRGALQGDPPSRVILTGPEPLLHPALPEILTTYAEQPPPVWLETLGLGLQREAPLRALRQRGLAGVRWLHAPLEAAPYSTYLREVSLEAFVARTAKVLGRSRLPVEHVLLLGAEPAAESAARLQRLRAITAREIPTDRWVTSELPLREAWNGWLGLPAAPAPPRAPARRDGGLPPTEPPDHFRTFLDHARSPEASAEWGASDRTPDRDAGSPLTEAFPFCAVERWREPAGLCHELLMRVTARCNQRCSFCSGPLPSPDPPLSALQACLERAVALYPGAELMLTGGEPLLREELPTLATQALATPRISRVYVQTNAVLAPRLAGLPADPRLSFFVSLHGVTDAVYDRCTGTTGQLPEALAGIHWLQDHGHAVILNCVVNRHNVAALDALIRTAAALSARGPLKSLHFSILMCPEHRPEAQDLLVPYHEAAPRLIAAWELARSLGVPVEPLVSSTHAAIPACLVGPAHRRPPGLRPAMRPEETGSPAQGRPWVKAPGCRRCLEDSACLGVPRPYYLRFGLDELIPIEVP